MKSTRLPFAEPIAAPPVRHAQRALEIRPRDTAIPSRDNPVTTPPLIPSPQRRTRHKPHRFPGGQPNAEALGRWMHDVLELLNLLSSRIGELERARHD